MAHEQGYVSHEEKHGEPDKPGYEEQDLHETPFSCNVQLHDYVRATFAASAALRVLDVGGGTGAVLGYLQKALGPGTNIDYNCIDVVPSAVCKAYGGKHLAYGNRSFDIVIFNYVLHHASGSTLFLLEDAKRVARKYVIVQEDMKGQSIAQVQAQFGHEWSGTFRSDEEWQKIFSLLGMTV